MPRNRVHARARAAIAIGVAAAGLLAPSSATAEPARVDDVSNDVSVDEAAPGDVLAPLLDPVGRVAGAGFDVIAATTAEMIAVATPAPPPPVACPAPEATFIDSWGFARSGGRRHKGVDMMAPHGSPVLAPIGGQIRLSNSALGGLGFWLEADDGNTYFGSHLQALHVSGGRVETGQLIGAVGSTGNAGGTPHLHFEVMIGGTESVNPYPFAAQWCPEGAAAGRST